MIVSGWFVTCLALFPLTNWAATEFNLPDLGEPASATLSELDEQQLGRQFMLRLRKSRVLIDDPLIEGYVNDLGNLLAQSSAKPDANYTFFVVEQRTLNAFAAPGGFIGINSGLILAAQTESELAGVLAHEISHATQKHLARLVARSKELTLPAAAATVAAILLGGQAGSAALVATNAAVVSDRLAYTRDFEREADAMGIKILHGAGFNANGMVDFFNRMQRWARVQDIRVPEFLRTHPLTANRIAEAQARLRELTRDTQAAEPTATRRLNYQLVRARIRALYFDEPQDALEYFTAELNQHRSTSQTDDATPMTQVQITAMQYGQALTNDRLGKHAQSISLLNTLKTDNGNNALITLALITSQSNSKEYDAALSTLDQWTQANGDTSTTQLMRANIYLDRGEPNKAYELTRKLSRTFPNTAKIQQQHARVAAKAGHPAESHESMAHYYLLIDNHKGALDQLFAARNLASGDYYANARIEARIEETKRAQQLLRRR